MSAGCDHGIAITADGGVWSWGSGGEGQLGHGDQQRQLLPKKIGAKECKAMCVYVSPTCLSSATAFERIREGRETNPGTEKICVCSALFSGT